MDRLLGPLQPGGSVLRTSVRRESTNRKHHGVICVADYFAKIVGYATEFGKAVIRDGKACTVIALQKQRLAIPSGASMHNCDLRLAFGAGRSIYEYGRQLTSVDVNGVDDLRFHYVNTVQLGRESARDCTVGHTPCAMPCAEMSLGVLRASRLC